MDIKDFIARTATVSIEELAAKSGIHPTTIRNWRRGVNLPSMRCFHKASQALERMTSHDTQEVSD